MISTRNFVRGRMACDKGSVGVAGGGGVAGWGNGEVVREGILVERALVTGRPNEARKCKREKKKGWGNHTKIV